MFTEGWISQSRKNGISEGIKEMDNFLWESKNWLTEKNLSKEEDEEELVFQGSLL